MFKGFAHAAAAFVLRSRLTRKRNDMSRVTGVAAAKPKPGRILVIEDDWDILEVLKLMLEGEDHHVVTAKHGREAMATVASSVRPFDLIVMDISMPEMSGIEVAQALRASPKTAGMRIVIHTALDEHWVRARFADYDLFLTKADDADVLLDEIARLLAQPAEQRGNRAPAAASFSSEDVAKAQAALRTAMGLGPEAFAMPAFLGMLGDEIGQLRRIGKSDADIAALLGETLGRSVPVEALRDSTAA